MRASLDQQASYIIQAMAMSVAAKVDRYAVYKAADEKAENDTELWGLIRNDRTTKPGYVAFQVGVTYFSNVKSAVFSWPGSAKPSPEQYKAIMRSNESRTQFVWPSQVSQVTMERGDHRTTVVWNNSPVQVPYRVSAASQAATLVTKAGKTEPDHGEERLLHGRPAAVEPQRRPARPEPLPDRRRAADHRRDRQAAADRAPGEPHRGGLARWQRAGPRRRRARTSRPSC